MRGANKLPQLVPIKFHAEIETMTRAYPTQDAFMSTHDEKIDPWAHIPKQYHGRWVFDYDEKRSMFYVHCNGHGICESEDSEVCDAICMAYNCTHAVVP